MVQTRSSREPSGPGPGWPGTFWTLAAVSVLPFVTLVLYVLIASSSSGDFSVSCGWLLGPVVFLSLAVWAAQLLRCRCARMQVSVLAVVSAQTLWFVLVMSQAIFSDDTLFADAAAVASVQQPRLLQHLRGSTESATFSVVLACAEEGEYAVKTAMKIVERTPLSKLEEVIVVDDGSTAPIVTFFDALGIDESRRRSDRIRIIRRSVMMGLMVAKKIGGDAAHGSIIAFFDCHVSPQPGWYLEPERLILENPRRMVVPAITDLDIDSWEERPNSQVNTKCYVTWAAGFDWFEDPSPYVPIMSGGLLLVSQSWWLDTGGYDESMRGWGGENLDQSLRCWLCGGEIMRAPTSRVAHMWRVHGDSRTKAKYTVKGSVRENLAKVVAAWFGPFKRLYPHPIPEGMFNLTAIRSLQQKLSCRPLIHFLHRFRDVYIAGAVIPSRVFQLRDKASGFCMSSGKETVSTRPCADPAAVTNKDELFRQRFHWANRAAPDEDHCCSGLRLDSSDMCFDWRGADGTANLYLCDVTGSNRNQQYKPSADGRIRHEDFCLVISASPLRPKILRETVKLKLCELLSESEGVWEEINSIEPLASKIYREELLSEGLSDPMFPPPA